MSQTTAVNCYEILGISSDATIKDVNTAYKKLALKYHPDKAGGVEASQTEFQKIQQAVETLRDPLRRKTHDLELVRLGEISVQETTFPRAGGAQWSAYGFNRYNADSRYMYSYENSVHVSPQNKESKEDMAWVKQMLEAEEEHRKNLARQKEQEQMRAQKPAEKEEGGANENDTQQQQQQQQQQHWKHGHPEPFQQYTFTEKHFQAEEDDYDFDPFWEIPKGAHCKDRNIWDTFARRAPQSRQYEEDYYENEDQEAEEQEDIYGEDTENQHGLDAEEGENEQDCYEDPNQLYEVEAEAGGHFSLYQAEAEAEAEAEEEAEEEAEGQDSYENTNELYEGDDEGEQESYAEEGGNERDFYEDTNSLYGAETKGRQPIHEDQAVEMPGAYGVDFEDEDEQDVYGDHQHEYYDSEAEYDHDSYEEKVYYESEHDGQDVYGEEYGEHDRDSEDSSFLPDDQLSEYIPSTCESEGEYATAKSNHSEFQNHSDKENFGAVPQNGDKYIPGKSHNLEDDTGVFYDFSDAGAAQQNYSTNPASSNDTNEIENNHATENQVQVPQTDNNDNDIIGESNIQHVLAPFIPYFRAKLDDPSGRYTEEALCVELRGIVMEIFCDWLENLRLAVPDAEIPTTGNDPQWCRHLGAWVKYFERQECEACHRWKPIYTLTCPGCGIKACVSCRFQESSSD